MFQFCGASAVVGSENFVCSFEELQRNLSNQKLADRINVIKELRFHRFFRQRERILKMGYFLNARLEMRRFTKRHLNCLFLVYLNGFYLTSSTFSTAKKFQMRNIAWSSPRAQYSLSPTSFLAYSHNQTKRSDGVPTTGSAKIEQYSQHLHFSLSV